MLGTKSPIYPFMAQSLDMLRNVCTVFNSKGNEITGHAGCLFVG